MAALVAVYDACILHSEPLRDFMVQLSLSDAMRVHWSNQIHDEWQRSVRRRKPEIEQAKLDRVRALMDKANPGGLVEGYESFIDTLTLPDPNDRHVLAAAIKIKADYIVTTNMRHFPQTSLEPYGIIPLHPDDFVLCILSSYPEDVYKTAKFCRARRKNPPCTAEEYIKMLELQEMVNTAEMLRRAKDLL